MSRHSIDLTGVPGFRADGPAARHHPKPPTFGEQIAGVAIAFFIVGLVVGVPVFTVLRLMGWW